MSTRTSSPFLDAANGQVGGHTPVWFMRQAGRSLPEYRAVRGEGSILDAIKRPELAAAITLQPVRRYGVDAAVLYSDIVVPPHATGFGIDVAPGTGPVAPDPLRRRADLDRLRPLHPDDIPYVAETVALVRAELGPEVPVLAFAGAPFTVASYLVEGGPSRTYEHTKALLHTDEALWHDVMDRLADMAVEFISVQLASGAQAFQLFDSWAGTLARSRLRALRPAALPPRVPRARRAPSGRAGHPLRHRVRPPPRGDARRRATRHGPRLAHARSPRHGPGSAPTSSSRATSTRRSCSPAPAPRSTVPVPCSPTTPGTRATSSTSATACTRRRTPACWRRSSTWCTRRRSSAVAR